MKAQELFDWPDGLPFSEFFNLDAHPWEWLPKIQEALASFDFEAVEGRDDIPSGVDISGPVYIDPSVSLPAYCTIKGPAWIGPRVEIRPGAYIRGNVIVGAGSVLGNACEFKNCLLMERVETPHYNYVGDSILGNRAHLGAGAICANLRLARDEVVIKIDRERFLTGLRKVGAFLGDGAEAGCNSVLQPGTILGRNAAVISMPFNGYLPAGKIALPENRFRVLPRPEA
ncbi:UDP-N-acetylglucosamine diphosphorylase [Puniceicoccales bacterium CK1056]|uniref:UDP-N-acetylglucosamine diphosphorylase n=1 Tax=Oceanipulchritudo coccoides TaxID=2706888 RepID=A0A6B2M2P2_9BACT|nr:UDP-N-acetylglucosamine diphosphorylase [Oceanipulchritudo coccoides]NDV63013.1 UDP-N-acetylglucosamine diphosphorylase [Oceanipulchritudo coccoides]